MNNQWTYAAVKQADSGARQFADRLFARLPWLVWHANLSSGGGSSVRELLIQVPSPTGDEDRLVTIWFEDGEPSVGFGPWHTHATCLPASHRDNKWDGIIDLVEAIFADDFVLMEDVGGDYGGHTGGIDRRAKDDLLDELTSKWSPGRARLKSWTGTTDKEVTVDDYDCREAD